MSHPGENTAMMNYGEAGIESISAVICRWRWMMKWRLRLENGSDGMDSEDDVRPRQISKFRGITNTYIAD